MGLGLQGRAVWRAVFPLMLGLTACGGPPPSQFPNGEKALEAMRAGLACSHGLQAEAKVDYIDEHGRVRGSLGLLASSPDRLRIDAYSPFGVSLSTLTSDGRQFLLYDLQHRELLEGRANACNLARFTQVSLPPHAFVQLLRGEAPVVVHAPNSASLSWESSFLGRGHWVVTVPGQNEAVERISLSPHPDDWALPWERQRLRLLSVALEQQGLPVYSVELADHAVAQTAAVRRDPDGLEADIPPSGPSCQAELPRRLRIVLGENERDVVLHYESVSHNPPLVVGAFTQVQPDGVRRRYSHCE